MTELGGEEGREPPLQRGEVVIYGDGKTGTVARAYPMEDKYSVKPLGSATEIRGPDNSFFYFQLKDLRRAVPLPPPEPASAPSTASASSAASGSGGAGASGAAGAEGEPPTKQARTSEATSMDAVKTAIDGLFQGPKRLMGRVKWYVKEKGFGKIAPSVPNGQAPAEEVFVHKNQMEGGHDGPHAVAINEGALVSYELTTGSDGKPCACKVQVEGVARALAAIDSRTLASREDLLRKLLTSGLQVGTFQVKGLGKAHMEDRAILRPGITVEQLGASCRKAICSLFGVFDGHSGASCSDFVANSLDRVLFECIRHQSKREVSSELAMRSSLLAAFRTTEHNYFQYLNKLEGGAAHAWATAGSTACTSVLYGPDEDGRLRLAVANAGDSRAVLGRRDGSAVRLSEDHTPNVPTERRRIEQEGAAITQANGIWRIVMPSKKGLGIAGLSVSRGFGDLEYKQPAGVVSAVPDVFSRVLDLREDSFIVLGSDGIWGSVSDAEAVRIVAAGLREGGEDPARAGAQQLVETAHQRDPHDDKTVVVVFFGEKPAAPPAKPAAPTVVSAPALMSRAAHRAAAGARVSTDDMFAAKPSVKRAQPDLMELDELFAGYARDIGQAPRRR